MIGFGLNLHGAIAAFGLNGTGGEVLPPAVFAPPPLERLLFVASSPRTWTTEADDRYALVHPEPRMVNT